MTTSLFYDGYPRCLVTGEKMKDNKLSVKSFLISLVFYTTINSELVRDAYNYNHVRLLRIRNGNDYTFYSEKYITPLFVDYKILVL